MGVNNRQPGRIASAARPVHPTPRSRRDRSFPSKECSIGSATALALHACGAEIAIHAESDEVIELTCRYFDAKGVRYERFVADFSNPAVGAPERMMDLCAKRQTRFL